MSFDLFGGSNKSTTQQTSNQNQVGVEGGTAFGAYSSGNISNSNGLQIFGSAGAGASQNVSITTDAAANSEAAFSTIDHLISMEAAAPNTAQTPSSSSPVIITGGGGSPGYSRSGGTGTSASSTGTDWVNIAVIGGVVLSLIVFLHTHGKSA